MSRSERTCPCVGPHSAYCAGLPRVNLAEPTAEKEPGEGPSATHRQRELQAKGAVLSGHSDCPTDEAEFWQNVGWG